MIHSDINCFLKCTLVQVISYVEKTLNYIEYSYFTHKKIENSNLFMNLDIYYKRHDYSQI